MISEDQERELYAIARRPFDTIEDLIYERDVLRIENSELRRRIERLERAGH